MTTTVDLPGLVENMPEAEYHAHPALSSTGARTLLSSPARFQYERTHPVYRDVFDVGSALHTKVLGKGWPIIVVEADDWRTKAAKEARDEARAAGQVPMRRKEWDVVNAMAEAVLADDRAAAILHRPRLTEVSAFGRDPITGVEMRARLDVLNQDDPDAADVKSAQSAADDAFAKSAATYGYHIQEEWYRRVLDQCYGHEIDAFKFIVVEKQPPYLVNVIELDAEFRQIARTQVDRALASYAKCTATGEWPGYAAHPVDANLVGPPAWLAYQEGMEI